MTSWFGADGAAWISGLPQLVEERLRTWDLLDLGSPFPGGTAAFVVGARTRDGREVVLKVAYPDDEGEFEYLALSRYQGRGAVALLAHDHPSRSLLLERARPGDPLGSVLPLRRAIHVCCGLAAGLDRALPTEAPLVTTETLRAEHLTAVRAGAGKLSRRLPRRHAEVLRAAVGALDRAPRTPAELINRDLHLGNVVSATRSPWLLIDPKPAVGERAFEAAYLLLDVIRRDSGPEPTPVRQWADLIAGGMGLPPPRVWSWACLRALESALWADRFGEPMEPWLELARRLAGA